MINQERNNAPGKKLVFRCRSMSFDNEYHFIEVPEQGHVICSCRGESWCSHIEATLIAGERAMVPDRDRMIADKAQVIAKGRIGPPEDWKADWRKNRKWRGLPVFQSKAMKLLTKGTPVVSIQGRGIKRKLSEEIAAENDWEIVPSPVRGVLVHVSADDDKSAQRARDLGIPISSHEEWPSVAKIGHILKGHMNDLLIG